MGCERHGGMCAYTGQEPGRCPRCHSTWAAISTPHHARYPDQGGGTPAQHEAWHDRRDAAAAKHLAARRLNRAA
jgi:hypothetical protein